MSKPQANRVFVSGRCFFFCVLFSLARVPSHGASEVQYANIGAIIDTSSRTGKEEQTAMEIAVKSFNDISNHHKLKLHIHNSSANPLEAAIAAQAMIQEKDVEVIVGMDTWEEAALVGDAGTRAHVPVLSFAGSTVSQSAATRWPYLVRMAADDSEQMKCIAAVISIFGWKRVTVIYEEDAYGTDSGNVDLLSAALQNVGSEIEHRVALPSLSPNSDPKMIVEQELRKAEEITQSRVFVVLRSSYPTTIQLFEEARNVGLMGKDSAWIVTDAISKYLDSFNTSVLQSMKGVLGVKKQFLKDTTSYRAFRYKFRNRFVTDFKEEEHNPDPGMNALVAHDSIKIIAQAIRRRAKNDDLLNSILRSKLTGLSGEIRFNTSQRRLSSSRGLELVNVVMMNETKYKELHSWLPGKGFSDQTATKLRNSSTIIWPSSADSMKVPKGWAMPTEAKPLVIAVPGRASFKEFVNIQNNSTIPTGFCIDLFHKVLEILDYNFPHKFVVHNDSYDNLVHGVFNKTYDAAIGDLTILATRSDEVDFTQPYTESSLSLIVPARLEPSTFMFLKPFTVHMWLVTLAILMYTVVVVWFLESKTSAEYEDLDLMRQFGTALWFTCSTLFFAHKEKVESNLTRVVVIVWLFVVIVLTSSYTASLSSMLTVKRLESDERTDFKWLKRNNKTIGCDPDTFFRHYLHDVVQYPVQNIRNVSGENKFEDEFTMHNIDAAVLELPYAKVFLRHHCKRFISTTTNTRFGGLAFAFQKGSPMGADFSRAILQLSQDGSLKKLEDKSMPPSPECLPDSKKDQTDKLTVNGFWSLYLISGGTSTICFLICLIRRLMEYHRQNNQLMMSGPCHPQTLRNKVARLLEFLCFPGSAGVPSGTRSPEFQGWGDSPGSKELVSPYEIAIGSRNSPTPSEVQMSSFVEPLMVTSPYIGGK